MLFVLLPKIVCVLIFLKKKRRKFPSISSAIEHYIGLFVNDYNKSTFNCVSNGKFQCVCFFLFSFLFFFVSIHFELFRRKKTKTFLAILNLHVEHICVCLFCLLFRAICFYIIFLLLCCY